MEERYCWLGFSVFPGIGPKRFSALLESLGTARRAWEAEEADLRPVLGNVFTQKFLTFRTEFSLESYSEKLRKKDVDFVILTDKVYPKLLRQTPLAPYVLYFRGDKKLLSSQALTIGVVGTRKITSYGKQVTEMITGELTHAGCIIVSGLAMGVDAVAHRVTLDNHGKTIAVLGSGVDVCHPVTNLSLYNSIIASGGVVLSEYPLGEPPSKGSFPSRNRIIAGLSRGIVVTEGAEDSGALITAEYAFAFGRRVFAVPGPITSSLSKGPNSLLAQGARLVMSGEDILNDLGIKSIKGTRGIKGDSVEEQQIIDLLQNESLLFDEIVKKTGFDSSKTGILLSVMEMKGLIQQTSSFFSLSI